MDNLPPGVTDRQIEEAQGGSEVLIVEIDIEDSGLFLRVYGDDEFLYIEAVDPADGLTVLEMKFRRLGGARRLLQAIREVIGG